MRPFILGASLAAAVLTARPARADDALPFTDDELAHALRVRIPDSHRVAVRAGAEGIAVVVDGRIAWVRLGEERGPDAARVVALVAAGLALDEPIAAPLDAPVDVVPPVHGVSSSRIHRGSLLARGTGAVEPGAASSAGVAVELSGRGETHWIASLGGTRTLAREPVALEVYGVPVRAGLEYGDRLAIGATAIAAASITGAGVGAASVLIGAGVHGRALVALTAPYALTIEGGVDVMANQVEYRWDGAAALRTGRVRPWLGLGVTWERR